VFGLKICKSLSPEPALSTRITHSDDLSSHIYFWEAFYIIPKYGFTYHLGAYLSFCLSFIPSADAVTYAHSAHQ